MANRFSSLAEVKQLNLDKGFFWFSKSTLRFFKTKFHGGLKGGRYFITSEQGPDNVRKYSVREAHTDGTITTLGEFQGHRTFDDAKDAAWSAVISGGREAGARESNHTPSRNINTEY